MYRKHPDRIDEAEASASWGFQGSLYSVSLGGTAEAEADLHLGAPRLCTVGVLASC